VRAPWIDPEDDGEGGLKIAVFVGSVIVGAVSAILLALVLLRRLP
jgi:hypothetical protein